MITLKSQLKNETTSSKKTIRDMESSLTECTARTQKAEREYTTLRDSMKEVVVLKRDLQATGQRTSDGPDISLRMQM